MVKTNRDQRRKLKRAHVERPPETLREYLSQHELVVRRGEAWQLMWKVVRLHELEKTNSSRWRRVIRWVQGRFGPGESVVDGESGLEVVDDD